MSDQNFAINLRLICGQYRSVAHVCRSLEMNRQQFNKYLSGKIYPSKHNLHRVCQFFKLSEEQLNLAPEAFAQVVAEYFQHDVDPASSEIEKVINMLPDSAEALARYEGYYYSHFHALGFPGHLVRSLVHIYRYKNRFYSNNTEHLWDKEKSDSHRNRFKYKGMVTYLGDRIFITEVEMLAKTAICHTILFPSYRNIVDTLSGITTGVGSINSHMPKATRVEYQYLGKQVDLREALRGCGIFDLESKQIDSDIRERIDNEMTDQEFMLTARDY
ncbi:MAG: hypothetical protein DRQ59_11455 [Gammaproteobacteria bacterium]|nr:MAG: hypothetical protein DRQ59_11455 [Gammaproteobacteria bacterium]